MSKPLVISSRSVFVPRGTATYTPKWSIVVLAVACLGVLKFYGPGVKTTAESETPPPQKSLAVPEVGFSSATNQANKWAGDGRGAGAHGDRENRMGTNHLDNARSGHLDPKREIPSEHKS
jgi:hypothetical protein